MRLENIKAEIIERRIETPRVRVSFPEVTGLEDWKVQSQINESILNLVYEMLKEQGYGEPGKTIWDGYRITFNQRGILNIVLQHYSYSEGAMHPLTLVKSLTIDLTDGTIYRFANLFKSNSNYVTRINQLIKKQIVEKDIPLLDGFNSIDPDQEFYLTENSVVVYYQLYRYTSYANGILEFDIPVDEIRDILTGSVYPGSLNPNQSGSRTIFTLYNGENPNTGQSGLSFREVPNNIEISLGDLAGRKVMATASIFNKVEGDMEEEGILPEQIFIYPTLAVNAGYTQAASLQRLLAPQSISASKGLGSGQIALDNKMRELERKLLLKGLPKTNPFRALETVEMGTQKHFWVKPEDQQFSITATCQKVGKHCYIFVDNNAKGMTAVVVNEMAGFFDREVYPKVTSLFDNPTDTDYDPRIYILFTKKT